MGIGAESRRRSARICRKGGISAAADCAEFTKKSGIYEYTFQYNERKEGKKGL